MSNDSLCFLTCLVFVTTVVAISLVNSPALEAINALSKTIDFCKAEDAIQDVIHATSSTSCGPPTCMPWNRHPSSALWRQQSPTIVRALQVLLALLTRPLLNLLICTILPHRR